LLLFSIKSKEESPCFAEKVPNGRTTNLVQEIFCATALNQCEALLFFAQLRPIGTCAANLFVDVPARVAFSLQKSLIYAIIEQKL